MLIPAEDVLWQLEELTARIHAATVSLPAANFGQRHREVTLRSARRQNVSHFRMVVGLHRAQGRTGLPWSLHFQGSCRHGR
jgi:hypothetical protein